MIAVYTDPGIGGTFLTWTIYFLSGKEKYFSSKANTVLDLPDNPLTQSNAHNFISSHPVTLKDVQAALPLLENVANTTECVYMHQCRTLSDTKECVDLLNQLVSKTVVVELSHKHALYNCKYKPRAEWQPAFVNNRNLFDPDDIYNDFVEHFFDDSNKVWEKAKLNDVWDKREFIALNFNPFKKYSNISDFVAGDYFYIDAADLWTQFETSVTELFEYLELEIVAKRFNHWQNIYQQWRTVHRNRFRFVLYFDQIVQSIITGADFDLKRFDLDIRQEAAIQRELMYSHNLNLKTWQLLKFENTKQLHNLLEPNIHDLTQSRCA